MIQQSHAKPGLYPYLNRHSFRYPVPCLPLCQRGQLIASSLSKQKIGKPDTLPIAIFHLRRKECLQVQLLQQRVNDTETVMIVARFLLVTYVAVATEKTS